MRRIILGVALLLHGLAHANAGMLSADDRSLVATALWAIASVAFLAAGFGLHGVRRLYRHWQVLSLIAIASSLLLLVTYRPATALIGIIVDVALLAVMGFVSISREWGRPRAGTWAAIGRMVVFAVLGYFSSVTWVLSVVTSRSNTGSRSSSCR